MPIVKTAKRKCFTISNGAFPSFCKRFCLMVVLPHQVRSGIDNYLFCIIAYKAFLGLAWSLLCGTNATDEIRFGSIGLVVTTASKKSNPCKDHVPCLLRKRPIPTITDILEFRVYGRVISTFIRNAQEFLDIWQTPIGMPGKAKILTVSYGILPFFGKGDRVVIVLLHQHGDIIDDHFFCMISRKTAGRTSLQCPIIKTCITHTLPRCQSTDKSREAVVFRTGSVDHGSLKGVSVYRIFGISIATHRNNKEKNTNDPRCCSLHKKPLGRK